MVTIATTATIRRHITIAAAAMILSKPLFLVVVVGARVPPVTHTHTGVCAFPDLMMMMMMIGN